MMLPLQEVLNKYNVHPEGVIHVGAHWAEEHNDYLSCGIKRFVYIEPCKDAFKIMCEKFGADVGIYDAIPNAIRSKSNDDLDFWNCACGAVEKDMPMYVSHQNQGQSNSLLEPLGHLTQHPEVIFDDAEAVKVIPLDKLPIVTEYYPMLVMDVQGYEGEVLKGAIETLKFIDIIYTEVNRGQTYAGNMEIEEMDELLSDFKRVETYWPSPSWTWGDAVYIRKTLL
jgi:FkbM family methyltransferase